MLKMKNMTTDREFMRDHFKAMYEYYQAKAKKLVTVITEEEDITVRSKLYELMHEYTHLEWNARMCYWEFCN